MLKFRQLNLQHCKLAQDHLIHELSKSKSSDILLLQEPYNYKSKIKGVPKNYQVYSCENSRAAILAPKSFNLWFCPEFSSKDFSVCLLNSKNYKLYLISAYLDINLDPCQGLEQIVKNLNFTGQNRCVIGMDSNAHSTCWGMDIQNNRGNLLEEFILSHGLTISNIGNKNTFVSRIGQTIIDVTLQSHSDLVYNWHVSDKHTFSDHKCIYFEVNIEKPKFHPVPNIAKCNWDVFKSNLPFRNVTYNYWDSNIIETECNAITNGIQKALEKSCPFTKPGRSHSWWSSELEQKSIMAKKLARKAWKSKKSEDFDALKVANKDLARSVRKAKRSRWHEFCESTNTPKQMAKLTKAIHRSNDSYINLLRYPNGSFTRSPEEVSNLLFDTHFPGSAPPEMVDIAPVLGDGKCDGAQGCHGNELKDHFVTSDLVVKAFKSFGAFKTPGGDQLRPVCLQNLNQSMVERITNLYRACIKVGYNPSSWLKSTVVFIPKPGKSDYSIAKSFRPISLVSFLLKGMERIIMWHLEDTTLRVSPISDFQHGFKPNFSTESALCSLVDDIESSILRDQIVLGVFLDCEGAFNNADHKAINDAMIEKNFPDDIRKWYNNFQQNRIAEVDILGHKSSRKLVKGVGQGLLSSSLAWNLIYDKVLKEVNNMNNGCKATGYCDDKCITIKGIDTSSMVSIMQDAVNVAIKWGSKCGVSYNSSKTVCTWFYRKYKWVDPKEKIHINGVPIEYSNQVRYLGINLDSKLFFNKHIDMKINSCKRLLMALRNAFGTIRGPSPAMLKYAFESIVIPTLTYGAVVFGKVCLQQTIQDKLKRLNRLISSLMMPLRNGTPTEGLEVILNLAPLDFKIQEAALKGYLRVQNIVKPKWIGISKTGNIQSIRKIGHLKWCKDQLADMGINDPNHDRKKFRSLVKNYEVDLESKTSGIPICSTQMVVFSDGSRMKDKSGYGVFISKGNHEIKSTFGALGKKSSVYQAEIYAIQKCSEMLLDLEPEAVTIFTDSQSALESLAQVTCQSVVVQNCIQGLNRLGSTRPVTIKWIKAHNQHVGNEYADALAKQGTSSLEVETIPPPISYLYDKIKQNFRKKWLSRWQSSKECRQTKLWFPTLNEKLSKHLIKLNRVSLGRIVQGITGFNRLMYHESLVDKQIDPQCRLCEEEGEVESFYHVVVECPSQWKLRRNIFHWYFPPDIFEWKVHQLLRFVEDPQIQELMEGKWKH